MDWLWSIIGFILGSVIGLLTGIVGSLIAGIGCLFGNESGCANFPTYFSVVTLLVPAYAGVAILAFVALHPRSSLRALQGVVAWLHYFFVPHPAESAVDAGRRYRVPQKIDPKAVVDAMKQDASFNRGPQHVPPAYQSENKRRRAEELRKAAEADRKLLEELAEREWARRRLEKAKRGKL